MVSIRLFVNRKIPGVSVGGIGPLGVLAVWAVAILTRNLLTREAVTLRKLIRRVNGRWYLVNGEIQSPEDDALDEFATLAAASDERLKELTKQLPVSPSTDTGSGQAD